MKKIFTTSLLGLLLTLLSTATASAYDFNISGIHYTIKSLDDMTVEIEGGDDTISGALNIPATITYKGRELKVASIGENAFGSNKKITSVSLPSTVDSIKMMAFWTCNNIKAIHFSEGLKYIGWACFNGIKSNMSIRFPGSLTCMEACLNFINVSPSFYFEYSAEPLKIERDDYCYVREIYSDRNFTSLYGFNNKEILKTWATDSLSKLTLGPHVTTWVEGYNGKILEDVYCEFSDPSQLVPSFSDGVYVKATLHVPVGTKSKFEIAEGWEKFWTIVDDAESPTGVENISVPKLTISTEGGTVTVKGVRSGENVSFYSIDGSLIGSKSATSGVVSQDVANNKIVIVRTAHFSKKIFVQ